MPEEVCGGVCRMDPGHQVQFTSSALSQGHAAWSLQERSNGGRNPKGAWPGKVRLGQRIPALLCVMVALLGRGLRAGTRSTGAGPTKAGRWQPATGQLLARSPDKGMAQPHQGRGGLSAQAHCPPGPCPGFSALPRKMLLGKEAEAPHRTPGGGHRGPPCHLPDTSPPPFFYSPQGWTHDCLSQANGANSGVLLAAPSSSWGMSQRTRVQPGAARRDFRETLPTENEANPGKRQTERSRFWIQLCLKPTFWTFPLWPQ